MLKLTELKTKIEGTKFTKSGKGVQQTQRNGLKKEILDTLYETLASEFTAHRTDDGVVILFETDGLDIYVAIDAVVKNLDYDADFEADEYAFKIEKQLERIAERERRAKEREAKK